MKVAIYLRVDAPSQLAVATAVCDGAKRMGETAWLFDKPQVEPDADIVVLFGIGGDAKIVYDLNVAAGKRMVLLDKPYVRRAKADKVRSILDRYHVVRVTVDGFQPLPYFQLKKRPSDRWDAFDIRPVSYRDSKTGPILFDGASNKYVAWNGLGSGTGTGIMQWAEWGQSMVNKIAQNTSRQIIYRPRPTHHDTPKIVGCEVSEATFADDLARAAIVVSHGGNIGFDAVVAGIPHFAIGDSIARPLSETNWVRVGHSKIPDERARRQWLCDVAYCQWTLNEFRDGPAWSYVRETMEMVKP